MSDGKLVMNGSRLIIVGSKLVIGTCQSKGGDSGILNGSLVISWGGWKATWTIKNGILYQPASYVGLAKNVGVSLIDSTGSSYSYSEGFSALTEKYCQCQTSMMPVLFNYSIENEGTGFHVKVGPQQFPPVSAGFKVVPVPIITIS